MPRAGALSPPKTADTGRRRGGEASFKRILAERKRNERQPLGVKGAGGPMAEEIFKKVGLDQSDVGELEDGGGGTKSSLQFPKKSRPEETKAKPKGGRSSEKNLEKSTGPMFRSRGNQESRSLI